MRYVFITLLLVINSSCNNATQNDAMSAKDILSKSIANSGGASLYNSTITFNVDELNYKLYRHNNVSDFELKRITNTKEYRATYKNGTQKYFIDNILQADTYLSRQFIETKLEALVYVLSIPSSLNQTSVTLSKYDDVVIKNADYYAIYASINKIENSDPDNEFIIYVNKNTFLVDYIAQNFSLMGQEKIFRKAYNTRTIEGIVFSDYFIFKSKNDSTSLEDLYTSYNMNNLEELKHLSLKDIAVEIH